MSIRLIAISFSLGLFACGGGGSTPNTNPDAPAGMDGPGTPDAPTTLTGLGQKCGNGLPACPTSAPDCIGFAGGNSFCTAKCVTGGTGMTNAQGQLTSTTPPPDNSICTGAFTGTGGMAVCGAILAITPMDNPLKANKNYTGIDLGCVVACGAGNSCPATMSCNTTIGACLPN